MTYGHTKRCVSEYITSELVINKFVTVCKFEDWLFKRYPKFKDLIPVSTPLIDLAYDLFYKFIYKRAIEFECKSVDDITEKVMHRKNDLLVLHLIASFTLGIKYYTDVPVFRCATEVSLFYKHTYKKNVSKKEFSELEWEVFKTLDYIIPIKPSIAFC
jgi:hypothetical protein